MAKKRGGSSGDTVPLFGGSDDEEGKGTKLKYHPAAGDEEGEEDAAEEQVDLRVDKKMAAEYSVVAQEAIDSAGQNHEYFSHVLKDPVSRKSYSILRRDGYTAEKAIGLVKIGAVNYRKENGEDVVEIDRAGLYHAIGEATIRAGGHEKAVRALEKSEYLTREEGDVIKHRIKKSVQEDLEHLARAAGWVMICLGALIVLASGFSVTGAVIGTVVNTSVSFVVGLVLLIAGLFMNFKRN